MNLVDTHCHLDLLESPEAAADEARQAGVTRMVCMGVDAGSSRGALELARRVPGVFAGAGHHPTSPGRPDLDALRELARDRKVVAIGEVGLDYAKGSETGRFDDFDALCHLAVELDLPLSIHNREAEHHLELILRSHPGVRGVMHYWALDWSWAQRFLELGFYISFSGLATRQSREAVRDVARRLPEDRLLLETDSPYGLPRGRPNEPTRPAWMLDVAELVAGLRGLSLEQLAEAEERNATALFTRLT